MPCPRFGPTEQFVLLYVRGHGMPCPYTVGLENQGATGARIPQVIPVKQFFVVLFCALALCLTTSCQRAATPPPFDVVALVGLPIDEITKKLGAPQTSTAPNQKSWTKGETTLTATFKPRSGRVTELVLVARAPENAVRDGEQTQLLEAGKLKPDDARYSVDWVEAPERPLYYNGVRIVPAPRTYQVQLRVTGPPDMLQISYAMAGATPPSDTFLTIAPWDITATLPDDATVQLSARTARYGTIASSPIVAEIVVDGKVVAIKKVSVVANCDWEL